MVKSISDTVALRSGLKVPAVGLGTYKSDADRLEAAVRCAVRCGYRHIDTATFYGNEKAVGDAVRQTGIDRSELIIAGKIWPTEYDKTEDTFMSTLDNLGLDYIDLYMMHWPGTDKKRMFSTYERILSLREKGLIRAVGASNFLERHLTAIKEEFGEFPEFDQIECHPWLQQKSLRTFCIENDIKVTSWGPLAHGHISELASDPRIGNLSVKYDVTAAQIVLRWHLQLGNIIIPKSINPVRIIENAQIFDFSLSDEDMRTISGIDRMSGFGSDPNTFDGL